MAHQVLVGIRAHLEDQAIQVQVADLALVERVSLASLASQVQVVDLALVERVSAGIQVQVADLVIQAHQVTQVTIQVRLASRV